jgi:hypothetical protein
MSEEDVLKRCVEDLLTLAAEETESGLDARYGERHEGIDIIRGIGEPGMSGDVCVSDCEKLDR